jgi:predicted ATP-dependent Lon-type protease
MVLGVPTGSGHSVPLLLIHTCCDQVMAEKPGASTPSLKDGVNIMKGYMESGEFSRGKESIRAYGGLVMVGNFEVDIEHQQRIGHLLGTLPPEMRF